MFLPWDRIPFYCNQKIDRISFFFEKIPHGAKVAFPMQARVYKLLCS